MFGSKRPDRVIAEEAEAALRQMDTFFANDEDGVLTVNASLAEAMGAFREDAVGQDVFLTDQETANMRIYGWPW